jgi:hypothetical protein
MDGVLDEQCKATSYSILSLAKIINLFSKDNTTIYDSLQNNIAQVSYHGPSLQRSHVLTKTYTTSLTSTHTHTVANLHGKEPGSLVASIKQAANQINPLVVWFHNKKEEYNLGRLEQSINDLGKH